MLKSLRISRQRCPHNFHAFRICQFSGFPTIISQLGQRLPKILPKKGGKHRASSTDTETVSPVCGRRSYRRLGLGLRPMYNSLAQLIKSQGAHRYKDDNFEPKTLHNDIYF